LWISFSDTLLQRIIPDPALMIRLSGYNDLLFIFLTSILLYKLFFRNIMQMAESNRQLLASEERFHAIYNNIYEAVFVHDALTGKIVDVNQAIYGMYGYSREEAIGDKCQDIGYPSLMLKSVTTSVTRYADLYKIS